MAPRSNIPIVHDEHIVTTVAEFIRRRGLVAADGKPLSAEALLNYRDPASGRTNRQQLRATYTPDERASGRYDGKEAQQLRVGALLYVPVWAFHKEHIATEGTGVYQQDDLQQVLSDYLLPLYTRPEYALPRAAHVDVQQVSCQVWAWCKSLASDVPPPAGQPQLEGVLLNLSPFVVSCTTSQGRQGGNFSLRLAPLVLAPGQTDLVAGLREALHTWAEPGATTINFTAQALTVQEEAGTGVLQEPRYLFHELLQGNDLVFISFEEAHPERLVTPGDVLELLPAVERLGTLEDGSPRIFDMLGLVDTNRLTTSPEAQVSISVAGRDLMKTLIDDGDYFPPTQYSGVDVSGMFKNQIDPLLAGHRSARRYDGRLNALQVFQDLPVADAIKFVLGQLSHIALAPDALFDSWGKRRTSYYYPDEAGKLTADGRATKVKQELGAGIWQIITAVVDETARPRKLVDSSLATAQGSLLSYLQKVCQAPFLEFYGDTYGDRYFLVARRPPHNRADYRLLLATADTLPDYHLEPQNCYEQDLGFSDQTSYSWYTLEPRGNFFGTKGSLRLAYLPSIFFPEFAEIYGNRHSQVVSNYINYDGLVSTGQELKTQNLDEQAAADLKWLVETTAYLPYSRSGTVRTRFDRRKRFGMAIRHLGTKEAFLIESVTQQWAITDQGVQADTTLQLTRGLVDDVATDGSSIFDRYFELVDFVHAQRSSTDRPQGAGAASAESSRLELYFDPELSFPVREPEYEFPAQAYGRTRPYTAGVDLPDPERLRRQRASQQQLQQLASELRRDSRLNVRVLVHGTDVELGRRRAAFLRAALAELVAAGTSGAELARARRQALVRIDAAAVGPHPTLVPVDATVPVVMLERNREQTAPPAVTLGAQQNWHVNRSNLRFFLQRRQFHGR